MIRAIVVEDELPALVKMVKLLESSEMARVVGGFTKPLEALEFLKSNKVDVVFLDIEMPDMNGIEFSSRILDVQEGCAVVFVTAYNQYAVEAFQLNALDYLMKPVSAARLSETLGKITSMKGNNNTADGAYIKCFGRFAVSNGTEQVKFRTDKAEEMLAFMIDKRGGFISRNEIIDSLWAEFDGERALVHFNTTLHYVKKALLSYGIVLPFVYERGGYKFDYKSIHCDYLKIHSFIEERKTIGQENILQYEEIVELYQDEYLSGYDYHWVEIRRLQMEELYYDLILDLAEYYKGKDNYKKAAKWIKSGLKREPLHRELNYQLIKVLLLDNDRFMALKYYDVYKKSLKKNLLQEPDKAFRKLIW